MADHVLNLDEQLAALILDLQLQNVAQAQAQQPPNIDVKGKGREMDVDVAMDSQSQASGIEAQSQLLGACNDEDQVEITALRPRTGEEAPESSSSASKLENGFIIELGALDSSSSFPSYCDDANGENEAESSMQEASRNNTRDVGTQTPNFPVSYRSACRLEEDEAKPSTDAAMPGNSSAVGTNTTPRSLQDTSAGHVAVDRRDSTAQAVTHNSPKTRAATSVQGHPDDHREEEAESSAQGASRNDSWPHTLAILQRIFRASGQTLVEIPAQGDSHDYPYDNGSDSPRACIACQDVLHPMQITTVSCGHQFCAPCLQDLFSSALIDQALFPPRCCRQRINAHDAHIRPFLSQRIIDELDLKLIEYDTVDKTYCAVPQCSAFIMSENIDSKVATCKSCQHQTCVLCKASAHGNEKCPEDLELKAFAATASKMGWQSCPKCHRFIELETGCNHITCPCGHEFCYNCAGDWRSCPCVQWAPALLRRQAQEIKDRNPPRKPLGCGRLMLSRGSEEKDEEELRAIADTLVVFHNCVRHKWDSIEGPIACELCGDVMELFIARCKHCEMQLCRTCKFQRI